jgi:hypothetical protein
MFLTAVIVVVNASVPVRFPSEVPNFQLSFDWPAKAAGIRLLTATAS